ncbi:FCD domain-containing protein [Pantoea septica]|uniref:FCD domain-containing protein n=1 Tax=Pantoea septica TaxID=472695 RepID=UPI00053422E9|nr:FCD domain-containing protein [Pantoea septica]
MLSVRQSGKEKGVVKPEASQEKKQYQEIGQHLRQQIIEGSFAVGSRMPPERQLAETFGVSRTIVREALLMLELEGTVDIRQGSGVYVMCIPSARDGEEEAFFTSEVGPFEMLQARQLLESNIAAFAARMATKADIENLRRTLEQEQRAIALNDTGQDNDKLFHLLLAGATQNQMLLETVTNMWRHQETSPLWLQLRPQFETKSWRLKWLSDHQNLLAALRRRDVMGSWQAMWQHIENEKKTLLELSDANAPDFDGYLFESVPIFQGKIISE